MMSAVKRHNEIASEIGTPSKSQKLRDQYCWHCHQHKPTPDYSTGCSGCARTFHKECTEVEHEAGSQNGWQCDQCRKVEDSRKFCRISKEKLNRALKFLYDRLLNDEEYKELKITHQLDIVNPMDLNVMKEKIHKQVYQTTMEFLIDILWIQHNLLIFDSSTRMKKLSLEFVNFCEKEIDDIKACDECYVQANLNPNWFSSACSRLHPVVWARVMGHQYHPAKAMNVYDNRIFVYFFGDHLMASIPIKSCLGFSVKNPNKSTNNTKKFVRAMKEVNEYIRNSETLRYAKYCEKLNSETKRGPIELISNQVLVPKIETTKKDIRQIINELLDENQAKLSTVMRKLNEKMSKEKQYLKTINDLTNELNEQKQKQRDLTNELNEQKQKQRDLTNELNEQKQKQREEVQQIEAKFSQIISETKMKKWCTHCQHESTLPGLPVFCSFRCGFESQFKQELSERLANSSEKGAK